MPASYCGIGILTAVKKAMWGICGNISAFIIGAIFPQIFLLQRSLTAFKKNEFSGLLSISFL
jgi:hypothetical protein